MNCVNTLHSTCSSICQKAHKSPLLFFTSSPVACPPPHEVSCTTSLSCPPPSLCKQTHALIFIFFFNFSHFMLETRISKVALHLTCGAFSASSFTELLTCFGFRSTAQWWCRSFKITYCCYP